MENGRGSRGEIQGVCGRVELMPPPYSVYCKWCGKHLSGPQTDDQNQISHGICKECLKEQYAEIEKLRQRRPLKPGQEG